MTGLVSDSPTGSRKPVLGPVLRALGLAAALVLGGCGGGGGGQGTPATPQLPVRIMQMLPEQGPPGARIELRGTGLSQVEAVTLGGVKALFVLWDDTKLVLWAPYGAASGPVSLIPRQGAAVSSERPFIVDGRSPSLWRVSPSSAAVHAGLTLFGDHLSEVRQVLIGGAAAPVKAVTDRQIRTSVPPGAVTGEVEVVTGAGLRAKAPNAFTVREGPVPDPEVTLMDPPRGPVGTRVALTGTGLANVTSVTFGGVEAVHELVDDTRLEAVVPAGAASGRITLVWSGRPVRSREDFTVTTAALAHPVIHSFSPESGPAGTRVELKGSGFDGVTKARIGGKEANHYRWDDTRLVTWVPSLHAVSGPVTLVSQAGTAHSATAFRVTHGPPEISDFFPVRGRPGTPVLVRGRNFSDLESVQFGPATAPEIRVLVPPGAASGPIRIKTLGGQAASSQPFTVAAEGFASKAVLRVESMYITQAVQTMDGKVPLVAGRDGLLRVFLIANADNAAAPSVRASILDARGHPVFTGDITAPRAGVPTEPRELVLEDSWNLPIPGSALQPGNTILLELAADPADASVEVPVRTWPASGAPSALDIRPVPPLRIKLFPVRSGATVGNVDRDGRTAESWLTRIRQFYPVDQVDVQVGPVFTAPKPLLADFTGYVDLRDALESKRLLEDSRSLQYWYGVFAQPPDGTLLGLAMFGVPGSNLNRSAIGYDAEGNPDGENCFGTIAHELGHTFDRRHAPCGAPAGPDLAFPHPGGSIGVYGFDVAAADLKAPETYRDVMGYCYPEWVSDYTYKAVMDFRAWELGRALQEGPRLAAGAPDAAASLLVWGTIDEGKLSWRPSFTSPQPPAPPRPGSCTLECLDGHGRALMQPLAFEADPVPDLPTRRDYRSFVFTIPMTPAMQAGPFTLHVSRRGHRLAESNPFPLPAHRLSAPREPVARHWGEGMVHLGWDHGRYPGVVVKDPRTHEILTIATGGSVELDTTAGQLECVFSVSDTGAGERSVTRMVKVE